MKDVDFKKFIPSTLTNGIPVISGTNLDKFRLHMRLFEYALHIFHTNRHDVSASIRYAMNFLFGGFSKYEFPESGVDISNLDNITIKEIKNTNVDKDGFYKTYYDGIIESTYSYETLLEVCRFIFLLDSIEKTYKDKTDYLFFTNYFLSLSFEKIVYKILKENNFSMANSAFDTIESGIYSRDLIIDIYKEVRNEIPNVTFLKCMAQDEDGGNKKCVLELSEYVLSQTSTQRIISLITMKMVARIKGGRGVDLKKQFLKNELLVLPQIFFTRNSSTNLEFISEYNAKESVTDEDKYRMVCYGGMFRRTNTGEYDINGSQATGRSQTSEGYGIYNYFINGSILYNDYGSLMNTVNCLNEVKHPVNIVKEKQSSGIVFEFDSIEPYSYKRMMGISFPYSYNVYSTDRTWIKNSNSNMVIDYKNFHICLYKDENIKGMVTINKTLHPLLNIFHNGFSRFTMVASDMAISFYDKTNSSISDYNYIAFPTFSEFECPTMKTIKEDYESKSIKKYILPLYNCIRLELFIEYLIKYYDYSEYPNSLIIFKPQMKKYFDEKLAEYICEKVKIFDEVK